VMVDVDMSLTPPKIIGRELCLQVRSLFRLLKNPRPKRHPNIIWGDVKKIKDSMKVENGGVHCKIHDGGCMK